MEIKRYIEENKTDEINPTILWDKLKAYTGEINSENLNKLPFLI